MVEAAAEVVPGAEPTARRRRTTITETPDPARPGHDGLHLAASAAQMVFRCRAVKVMWSIIAGHPHKAGLEFAFRHGRRASQGTETPSRSDFTLFAPLTFPAARSNGSLCALLGLGMVIRGPVETT